MTSQSTRATEFIALCDETLVGWIRFYNDGETPPDRVQGLLFDGFILPAARHAGRYGRDPVEHRSLRESRKIRGSIKTALVLQQTETRELYTFVTTSITGRRAVGNLLRHYKRMRKTNPDEVPVVRLRPGGFNHRDPRVGWVPTPAFAIVGRTPRDSAAKPDTSVGRRSERRNSGLTVKQQDRGRHIMPAPFSQGSSCRCIFARCPTPANPAHRTSASPTIRT